MANSVNRYFEGLLVGGALGFIFGMLTAPKPGAELRRELTEQADDMLKHANENWIDIKDRVSDRVQPLSEKAGVYKEQVMTRAAVLKEKYGETASQLKDKYGERAMHLSEKASHLKEKAVEKAGELKEKMGHKSVSGADLMNNYMGNNSGPMYTAGAKVSPDASATPVSDSCSNYSAGKAGEGAAGG
jgi:gas vesicle protein